MKNSNLKFTTCPICESDNNYSIIYRKNFKTSDLNQKVFSARRLPDKIHYQIVKCNTCGLVRSNPIATSKTLNKLYRKSTMNYSDEIHNLAKTYIYQLGPILNKLSNTDNILEIGCGNGFVLAELFKLGYKNIFGIEPSFDATSKANSLLRKKIINEPLNQKSFINKKFKLIYMFQTFDHIPNPNKFLNICHNLLDKNGYILTFNHNINSLSSLLLKDKSPIIDIEHTYFYSPQSITKLFKKHKFKIVDITTPHNLVSFKHLIRLTPLPIKIKKYLLNLNMPILNSSVNVKLGNLSLIAQK